MFQRATTLRMNLAMLVDRLGRTADFLVYGQGQQRRAVIEAVRLLDNENKGTNSEFCKLNEMPDVKSHNQFKDKSKKWLKFVTQVFNVLSKLPSLEVLKLMDCELGKKWELPENVKFCQLICMKILQGNLKHWEVGVDNFPKLERLFLNKCSELREIPNSFAEISTLNLIQLERCHPSAVMSAKQIQAEQQDYGNENIVVIEKNTKQGSPRSSEDDSNEGKCDEDDTDEGEFDEDDSDEGEFEEDDSDEARRV
nr:putative late blight resistance protein homolog R1B-16 [Ipomoea batatas]